MLMLGGFLLLFLLFAALAVFSVLFVFFGPFESSTYPGRIALVTAQRVCVDSIGAPSDSPWRGHWCEPVGDVFYSRPRRALSVGECVRLVEMHPLVEIAERLHSTECSRR